MLKAVEPIRIHYIVIVIFHSGRTYTSLTDINNTRVLNRFRKTISPDKLGED